jgi:hypothetical protein
MGNKAMRQRDQTPIAAENQTINRGLVDRPLKAIQRCDKARPRVGAHLGTPTTRQ